MSDPVSNAEIEDVLSSIRRLVSEEPSLLNRRKQAAEAGKDRLVLTPALRVPDDAETAPGADDADEGLAPGQTDPVAAIQDAEAAPQLGDTEDRYVSHRQTLENRIAELEAALQNTADEWEPDGSEVPSTEPITMPVFHGQANADAALEPAEDEADDAAAMEGAEADGAEMDLTEAEPAEVELAEADAETEWAGAEAETELAEAEAGLEAAEAEAGVEIAEADPAETFRAGNEAEEGDASPDEQSAPLLLGDPETGAGQAASVLFRHGHAYADRYEDAALREDSVSLAPAAPEDGEVVPQEPDDYEYDAASDEALDASTEAETGADRAEPEEAEILGEPAEADQSEDVTAQAEAEEDSLAAGLHEVEDEARTGGEDDGFDMFASDTVLDENALRELVGQLVREELQGVLGERITRNVRRLVRREIQRALAVNELE